MPHDADVFIENFKPFDSFIAIEQRAGGNKRLRLLGNDGTSSDVASDEPAYAMALGDNRETDATKLRYTYDSLTTPEITYEVDAATGARTVLKRTPAPSYDPSQYVTERVWATGARRHQDPGLAWSIARASSATAPRRCCNMAMAATACRWTRPGRRP